MGKIHPEAERAYNEKAAATVSTVRAAPPRASARPPDDDTHVAATLDLASQDQDSYREYESDVTGVRKSLWFLNASGELVGIGGKDHDEVLGLAGRFTKERAYRDEISSQFVYDRLVDWIARRVRAPDSIEPFTTFLESASEKAVEEAEIWFPIPIVSIARPFLIGRTWFRRITKTMIDQVLEIMRQPNDPDPSRGSEFLRSRVQGATAACCSVKAEPVRARELAAAEATASVAILRLALPALLTPHKWAPVALNSINIDIGPVHLRVRSGRIIGLQESTPEHMLTRWILSQEDIAFNFGALWAFGHNLLVIDRNEFQESLLDALIHYSASGLKADTAERLVYIMTALESLLVARGENVVQNLAERLAVMAAPPNRQETLDTVRAVYDIRSSFVHGAMPVKDLSLLEGFFMNAWSTMCFLLNNYDKWRTKKELLSSLDTNKLSGPQFTTKGMPPV